MTHQAESTTNGTISMHNGAAPASNGGSAWPLVPAGRVSVIDVDPELAEELAPEQREATRRIAAPAYRLRRGPLAQAPAPSGEGPHLGYLVARGLLLREVVVLGRPAAELIGPGALIQPWPDQGVQLLPRAVNWSVVEKAIVLDLGGTTAARLLAVPGVVGTLVERSVTRAHSLALERAISSHVRVDVRVLTCLWHLAEHWGVVTPEAVRINLPLTHALLARMVAARRPTVTTALQRLMQLGYVRREEGAYVLLGDPSSIEDLDARSPSHEASANGGSANGGSANGASANGGSAIAAS